MIYLWGALTFAAVWSIAEAAIKIEKAAGTTLAVAFAISAGAILCYIMERIVQ